MGNLAKLEDRDIAELFNEHLPYEINMLSGSHWLCNDMTSAAQQARGRVFQIGNLTSNALIEAWAIHARNLLEFFQDEGWDHAFTKQCYKSKLPNKKWMTKISNQIGHLGKGRTVLDAEKIDEKGRLDLTDLLRDEVIRFRGSLDTGWPGRIIPDIAHIQVGIGTSSGTTGPNRSS